jgi:aminoglycoside 6'-N-acetyltransferase I
VVVGQRSHADGCDERHPVGYVEGWYVAAAARATGVGRALIEAAEAWARALGCREMASDTWHDNEPSILAHQALGYELVEHVVLFRKAL